MYYHFNFLEISIVMLLILMLILWFKFNKNKKKLLFYFGIIYIVIPMVYWFKNTNTMPMFNAICVFQLITDIIFTCSILYILVFRNIKTNKILIISCNIIGSFSVILTS